MKAPPGIGVEFEIGRCPPSQSELTSRPIERCKSNSDLIRNSMLSPANGSHLADGAVYLGRLQKTAQANIGWEGLRVMHKLPPFHNKLTAMEQALALQVRRALLPHRAVQAARARARALLIAGPGTGTTVAGPGAGCEF